MVTKIRRTALMYNNAKNVTQYPIAFSAFSNSWTNVDKSTYSGEKITINVLKAEYPSDVLNYKNGYFSLETPFLEFEKKYIFTADVDVISDLLSDNRVGLAPVGVNAKQSDGIVQNGKIRVVFTFNKKTNSDRKFIEFRCGGKSMGMKNITLWNA